MTPIATIATNTVMSGEGCFDLPICRDAEAQTQTSYWAPDADELAQLNAGVPLQLVVFGRFHPPVMLQVGD